MQGAFLLLVMQLTPGIARASDSIALTSTVFVEKSMTGDDGKARIVLDQPNRVQPGDNLVFVLRYRNSGKAPATHFSVTNPLPASVSFRDTNAGQAQYSVDGGQNWGTLGDLKLRERAGRWRSARPDDVTHVRWTFRQALPVGASGRLTFRGTVR